MSAIADGPALSEHMNMDEFKYVKLDDVNPDELKILLNKQKVREHLIEHDMFDSNTIKVWVKQKKTMDHTKACRVRGITSHDSLVGWCGIQLEEGKYELAIVLDDKYWGMGRRVFKDVMPWAKELGHDEVFIHLLHTRPEYRFLRKIAKNVIETEYLGDKFTTYLLSVH